MDTPQQYPTMWTTGYLKNGMKVSFTFPIRNEMEACKQALEITNKLIADGFMIHEPGLEAGEESEMIGRVSRRAKKNNDGTISPIIDLFGVHDALKFKIISMYLDTPEDIAAFESACGVKLASLPLNPTKAAVERDDENFVVVLPQPAKAILKANPDYREDSDDKKPKRKFVRWEFATPAPVVIPTQAQPDYDAIEKAAREKAATALDNEAVTIFKATYQPTHNGNGAPSWMAMARIADGSTIPVTVGERGAALIAKAGYVWPKTDADDLAIDVITSVTNGKRYIKSVICPDGSTVSEEPRNAANANVATNNIISDAWLYDRTKLLYAIGKQFPKVTPQERAATADKMHKEGLFDELASLDDAVTMVANRLAGHRQAVNS